MPFLRETLNVTGGMLAVLLTLALWFLLYALVYIKVPDENQNALLIVIGILSTNLTSIVAFYFGSSVGAKRQSETIDTLANTAHKAMPHRKGHMTVEPGKHIDVEGVESKNESA
jgi:hypothetical protein